MLVDPLVSIICSTLPNREHLLRCTLSTVNKLTYINKETIIICKPELTTGACLNLACEQAKGDYIYRIDDDLSITHYALSIQMNAIGPYLMCGTSRYYSYNLLTKKSKEIGINQLRNVSFECLLFKKEAWIKTKFSEIRRKPMGDTTPLIMDHCSKTLDLKDNSLFVSMRHNMNMTIDCPPSGIDVDNIKIYDLIKNDMHIWNQIGVSNANH